ncbi:MAG TPA: peptidoglycan DD-metalloendopeptidase family protein [Gemmatimonadota bacterium]|nr:peptidoglycan DD-metalloendopeptidase family protein [Gemmatimonadota bacterium]
MGGVLGVRPPFLIGLAGASLAWWLASDPQPPAPRTITAAPALPPAIVDTVAPGQTLSGLWEKHALDPADLPAVVQAGGDVFPWRQLRSGVVYRFQLAEGGALRGLDLKIDRDRRLVVRRHGGAFHAELLETVFVRRPHRISACIESSPWEALVQAGEDPTLTVTMAEVLGAQVDFYTDLRPGDCFEAVILADERPDGSYIVVSLDAIRLELAAKTHEAYRFAIDGDRFDYYDAEGRSLKRRFLRSPLKFTRISSGFGMRVHPISRRRRAHNGVDYVAPVGTPVQAAGDGVVVQAGRNGGHGLYIKLQHGNRYFTSYSHLSRIARGVSRGARVQQGQVIAHVGSTGMSTGAHLDYRFMKDGRYVDPLSTDLPTAEPLDGAALAVFAGVRDGLRLHLDAADARFSRTVGTVPSAR